MILKWDPDKGDAFQGDVMLFRLPDELCVNTDKEIKPQNHRLILAEGEVTGHHHSIMAPAFLKEDEGAGGGGISIEQVRTMIKHSIPGVAKLYKDETATKALVNSGELTSSQNAIGFLIVDHGSVVLEHQEHDSIRIPAGRYYVGGQSEWDAEEERRVKD